MSAKIIVIVVQVMSIFAFLAIITALIRVNNAYKLEKRISKYSINGNKSKEVSWYDRIVENYSYFVKKQRKKIGKLFPVLTKYYDKYSIGSEYRAEDYITTKLVISMLFVMLTIVSTGIKGKAVGVFQIIVSLFIGFYTLDIYLVISHKAKKKKIQNDMLRAIIIMNNAFKSGKSTIQAVEIAGKKLPKPIGYEFIRIYEEMKYGLSVDTVFNRFSKRVNIEEAEYLSSSLTILNKTGGNIVAVFDSIEKTLLDKKRMREDLKSTTTVSKLVVRILLFAPIFFVTIIYILNPNYFEPFFSSTLGYFLLFIVILMFAIYVYLLNRIVKVEY